MAGVRDCPPTLGPVRIRDFPPRTVTVLAAVYWCVVNIDTMGVFRA